MDPHRKRPVNLPKAAINPSPLRTLRLCVKMAIGRLLRTVHYLKPTQIFYQIWRRVQKRIESHPKCATGELPEFTFLNLTARPKGWNDESLDMLWRYNLHYFDWLSSAESLTQRRRDAEYLIKRWTAENPRGSVPGWDPYPTSLRIVNWVKWLDGFNHGDQVERVEGRRASLSRVERVEDSLKEQIDWLARHVEWHLMANHLMANLKALIIGNRYLGRDYSRWMRLYREQVAEQIMPDGGHFERSVMYHAIILEDMLDVMRLCGDEVEWLKSVTAKMLRYLVNMTGPDGKIAMFNDAADGIAKPTEWLCGYARSLGVEPPLPEPFADFPDTGYTRMAAGDFVLFVDTGAVGPDYQPGHAHADTLTYELYWKECKVVTDTGTSEYRGKRRAYERSTAAHNVVEVDGRNSSEVWSSHRVGARARIVERQVSPGFIWAAHDGYGFKIGREWRLTEEGLTVTEKFLGNGSCVTRVHVTEGDVLTQRRRGAEKSDDFEVRGLRFYGLEKAKEYEYAVEFGKLRMGTVLSVNIDPSQPYTYSISKLRD